VFFHLAESQQSAYPFAFLATYSTKNDSVLAHVPLNHALVEYQGQQKKLLSLLSTVSSAANSSAFISELMESGELFAPLKFTREKPIVFCKNCQYMSKVGLSAAFLIGGKKVSAPK